MSFTKKEWEILDHRLGVPDAIIDSLTDVCEDETPSGLDADEIGEVCELLSRRAVEDAFRLDHITASEVLRNCVEASTYCATTRDAIFNGEAPATELATAIRCGYSLARKIARLDGGKIPRFATR